jgi:hypothetical protein
LVKKSLSFFVFFSRFIYYLLAPPRQVGGLGLRDALGWHPYADSRRWRPAGGAVAQEPNWV